ncbi:MAG: hypothetical protein E5V89_25135 [Mesorhizobium sp.]|nr:MAG: hypothetical protein E5V89_25135 [Mesorhizobium sp.]
MIAAISTAGWRQPCGFQQLLMQQFRQTEPVRRLIELGFVKLAKRGLFDWKARGENRTRASTWILTEYSLDYPERSTMPPTNEFMKWRPEKIPPRPIGKKHRVTRSPQGVTASPEWGEQITRSSPK